MQITPSPSVPAVSRPHSELTPRLFRVVKRRRETADTVTLELEAVDGRPFKIRPGQFNMLYAFGVGEIPVSVSGIEGRLVHTVRAVGAVSTAVCRSRPGDVLGVRGPYGTAWPLDEAEGSDLLFIAGGIGLAPLRPAIVHFLANHERYGSGVLLCGSRTPGEILFEREVERWAEHSAFDVDLSGVRAALTTYRTVDVAGPSWRGMVGPVPQMIPKARLEMRSTVAFICGPEVLIRFAAEALLTRGLPPRAIHVSLERNMRCGIGLCGHCQLGPTIVCRDGPVYAYPDVEQLLEAREL
jgi:NAD(P)H-flavin reductase